MNDPQTLTVQAESPLTRRGVINCAAYEGGKRVADLPISRIRDTLEHTDQFIWIGLFEPDEELLREVQQAFDLHDLAIEDAHSAHQRPKLERYDDSLFVVLRTAQLAGTPSRVQFAETHVFVGRRYIVTVRHGSLQSHVGVRARCETEPALLSHGPAFVLHALMDFIVDQYFPIVDALEEELEQLEEEIFGDRFSRATTQRIYQLKRDLLGVKRAVWPLVDVCNRLMRLESDLVPEDTRPYFRDVYDHVLRINEIVDNLRELLTAALDANLSLLSMSQNEDTKRLAAWAAIIAVPTMVAGVYGMNFSVMPELTWTYGYPAVLAAMAAACVALYRAFKRSRWL